MKQKKLILLTSFLTAATASFGQLPDILVSEEKAFIEALNAVRLDYKDRELLEVFIQRYPASKHTATAKLELERAQLIEFGTYDALRGEPSIINLSLDEKPYQVFFENQNELAGENPDFKELREKYTQLLEDDNKAYRDEANYYLGYIDYAEGKYKAAKQRWTLNEGLWDLDFYLMQIDYAEGNYANVLETLKKPEFVNLQGKKKLEATRIKAESLARTGNTKEALDYFKQYIDDAQYPIAPSAYNCAVLAFNASEYSIAQKAAIKAIQTSDERLRQYSYMVLGQAYMLTSDTPKAKMAFEQAATIDADPEVKEAADYNNVVLTHETSYSPWGDEVQTIENFLNKYPSSKYNDNVSMYLTEVYLTTKNYEAALASVRKIKKTNQTILNAKHNLLYQCGVQEYINGNYKEANNLLTECVSTNSSDNNMTAPALYWRGESRYHLGMMDEAAADYKKSTELTTDSHIKALNNYSLGYVFFKKKAWNDAAECFSNLSLTAGEKSTETYYDALARLGDCAYYVRNFANAENYYNKVAESESNSAPYALFQQAFMAGLQKRYADKQKTLDILISRFPKTDYMDIAWLEKGNTAILQNDNNAAIIAFKHVVDNYPSSHSAPQAAVQLAMTYNNTGQTAKAQEIYKLVAEKYPDTDEAATAIQDLNAIATSTLFNEMPEALANDDYQKVLDNFEKLSAENVDFRDLQKMQLMAAKAHQALGNEVEAMKLIEECAKDTRTETGAEARYLYAQKLFDNGETDEALAKVSEFLTEGTPHQYWLARAIILMSDISAKNDDAFTATEYLKSLKVNYTENEEINKMIEERLNSLSEKSEN